MKRRDLVQQLNALGWFPVRQGKRNLRTRRSADYDPVPRHAEITEFTARAIRRKAKEV